MTENDGLTSAKTRVLKASPGSMGDGVKKQKTGGRKKCSIDEMLERARIANEIAPWHDDTTIPAELAAIYLGISLKQLGDLRNKPKPTDESRGVEGPLMIKIVDKGSVGQNQPVNYKLGDLRKYQAKNKSTTSFGAALNAGLLGWTSMDAPFFAKPAAKGDRGRVTLIGAAWDRNDPLWGERFLASFDGKLRAVWMSPAQAASSRWEKLSDHRKFAKPWLALMKDESRAVKAALGGTEIAMGLSKAKAQRI